MVNWGELVIAAAVVVEKFERRIAVGANKDRRQPRMSPCERANEAERLQQQRAQEFVGGGGGGGSALAVIRQPVSRAFRPLWGLKY